MKVLFPRPCYTSRFYMSRFEFRKVKKKLYIYLDKSPSLVQMEHQPFHKVFVNVKMVVKHSPACVKKAGKACNYFESGAYPKK